MEQIAADGRVYGLVESVDKRDEPRNVMDRARAIVTGSGPEDARAYAQDALDWSKWSFVSLGEGNVGMAKGRMDQARSCLRAAEKRLERKN